MILVFLIDLWIKIERSKTKLLLIHCVIFYPLALQLSNINPVGDYFPAAHLTTKILTDAASAALLPLMFDGEF